MACRQRGSHMLKQWKTSFKFESFVNENSDCQKAYYALQCTVEPRSTYTRILRTLSFVPTKSSYIFSKINQLNTDTGHFFVSRVTNSHTSIVNAALRTLFICALSIFIVWLPVAPPSFSPFPPVFLPISDFSLLFL